MAYIQTTRQSNFTKNVIRVLLCILCLQLLPFSASVARATTVQAMAQPVSIMIPSGVMAQPSTIGFLSGTINSSYTVAVTNPPPSYTTATSYTLNGTKTTNTDVYINNDRVSALYVDSSWSAKLVFPSDGNYSFSIIGRDTLGKQSQTVTINTVRDTTPPLLSITSPVDGIYTNNPQLTISGTVSDANLSTVSVNSQPVSVANGSFSAGVTLTTGNNTITVTATDLANNATTAIIHVYYDSAFDMSPPVVTASPAGGYYKGPQRAGIGNIPYRGRRAGDTDRGTVFE